MARAALPAQVPPACHLLGPDFYRLVQLAKMAQTGPDMHQLAQTGPDMHKLAQTCTKWTKLDQTDPIGPTGPYCCLLALRCITGQTLRKLPNCPNWSRCVKMKQTRRKQKNVLKKKDQLGGLHPSVDWLNKFADCLKPHANKASLYAA